MAISRRETGKRVRESAKIFKFWGLSSLFTDFGKRVAGHYRLSSWKPELSAEKGVRDLRQTISTSSRLINKIKAHWIKVY